jgi:hypothetical protein
MPSLTSCALLRVWVFGANGAGQLGLGHTTVSIQHHTNRDLSLSVSEYCVFKVLLWYLLGAVPGVLAGH